MAIGKLSDRSDSNIFACSLLGHELTYLCIAKDFSRIATNDVDLNSTNAKLKKCMKIVLTFDCFSVSSWFEERFNPSVVTFVDLKERILYL